MNPYTPLIAIALGALLIGFTLGYYAHPSPTQPTPPHTAECTLIVIGEDAWITAR